MAFLTGSGIKPMLKPRAAAFLSISKRVATQTVHPDAT